MTKHYIITDYDGTFTNTHDVISFPDATSSDSPEVKDLIQTLRPAGVYGCTHRNTDGYAGFLELVIANIAAPLEQVKKQKLVAIEERLAKVCEANGVHFYGTSTEYDQDGIFTGIALVKAAEDAPLKNSHLSHHKKLQQIEKNAQLQQIIDHILALEPNHSNEPIILHFYDDKQPIHDALRESKLHMPSHMQLNSYLYKYSSQSNKSVTQVNQIFGVKQALVSEQAQVDRLQHICQQYYEHFDEEQRKKLEELLTSSGTPDYNSFLVEPTLEMLGESNKLAVIKCYQIGRLLHILGAEVSAHEKLQRFKQVYHQEVKGIIEKHRDHAAIRFLKWIATIFTFGAAQLLGGILNVHGEKVTKMMDEELQMLPEHQVVRST